MQKRKIKAFCIAVLSIAFFNGCTGTEAMPNNATQTGAVGGALLGSVIGYNSGNSSGTNAAVGALIGTALGAGVGSMVDNRDPEPQQTGGWQ